MSIRAKYKIFIFRYEDFFGSKRKKAPKKNLKSTEELEEDSGLDDEEDEDEAVETKVLFKYICCIYFLHIKGSHMVLIKFHLQSGSLFTEITLQVLFLLQKNDNLSTHEKQSEQLRAEIEKMEKANLDPKTWTMQGEVTLYFANIVVRIFCGYSFMYFGYKSIPCITLWCVHTL